MTVGSPSSARTAWAMCGLCGVWRGKGHWSARAQNPAIFAATRDESNPLRERFHQMAFVNRVIRHLGVSVRDWEGVQWIVESANGGSEIVADIAALWPAVERVSRRKLDPLSLPLLDRFACDGSSREH